MVQHSLEEAAMVRLQPQEEVTTAQLRVQEAAMDQRQVRETVMVQLSRDIIRPAGMTEEDGQMVTRPEVHSRQDME